jgi:hypothetical protein
MSIPLLIGLIIGLTVEVIVAGLALMEDGAPQALDGLCSLDWGASS